MQSDMKRNNYEIWKKKFRMQHLCESNVCRFSYLDVKIRYQICILPQYML